MDFFGGDELLLPPGEAEERLNAYYLHRQEATLARYPGRPRPRDLPALDVPAFKFPDDLAHADTIGVIYDEIDGLNFYIEYGMLHDLFANPALAADKRYSDALRGYLGSETIGPLPFHRLAAAYPETVDEVFRKTLRKRDFCWTEHGESLLRRRKPWYYEAELRPGISVIGARLSELAAIGPGAAVGELVVGIAGSGLGAPAAPRSGRFLEKNRGYLPSQFEGRCPQWRSAPSCLK